MSTSPPQSARLFLVLCGLCTLLACAKEPLEDEDGVERSENWGEASHSKSATPNYDLLFATDQVQTLHITIDASDFTAMREDLQALVDAEDTDNKPIYIPVTVEHEGVLWEHVGMRYKGGSSTLTEETEQGNGKLPFRLNFDYWEDQFPEIKNQRFYGFDKMIFASGVTDSSNLRDMLASEILQAHGVPVARTAFYRVVVNTGQGDTYWGLYTMLEDPSDDAMLDREFGSHSGNLYKPEGEGADWVSFSEEGFEKKSNEEEMDYSDIQEAIEALHAEGEGQSWRDQLEARFDVDGFLRWLAINTTMQNRDAYGNKARNYYLYTDPSEGRLRWIPWDHDRALSSKGNAEVMYEDAGEDWPLISRLLADDQYRATYQVYLAEALEGPLAVETFSARVQQLHALIAPHMTGGQGESPSYTSVNSEEEFEASVDELIEHIQARHEAVSRALEEEE